MLILFICSRRDCRHTFGARFLVEYIVQSCQAWTLRRLDSALIQGLDIIRSGRELKAEVVTSHICLLFYGDLKIVFYIKYQI